MSADMEEPKIRWDFSLGNLTNLVALGATAAVAWGSMTTRSDMTHKGISDLEDKQVQTEKRILDLEKNQARADERLSNILQIVSRIENKLERK